MVCAPTAAAGVIVAAAAVRIASLQFDTAVVFATIFSSTVHDDGSLLLLLRNAAWLPNKLSESFLSNSASASRFDLGAVRIPFPLIYKAFPSLSPK
jgi:hypothetical protein